MNFYVEGMAFDYPKIRVLEEITFNLSQGDSLALLGRNGAGKSTMLKCFNRILKPKKGRVSINGIDTRDLHNREIARTMAFISQDSRGGRQTVFDTILLGRRPHIKWDMGQRDIKITQQVISRLNLDDYAMRYIDELSGGELQKVMIARALVQEPKILLMDEPTSSLDMKNQYDLTRILRKIIKEKKILAIVSMHDLNLAFRFANKFLFLREGKIDSFGGREIITEETIKRVYGVDINLIDYEGIPLIVPKV